MLTGIPDNRVDPVTLSCLALASGAESRRKIHRSRLDDTAGKPNRLRCFDAVAEDKDAARCSAIPKVCI